MSSSAPPYLRQLQLGPMANFVYLLGAEGAPEVAVVDPSWDAAAIDRAAKEDGKKIDCVILTHGHPDHVNALEELLGSHGVPVYVQRAELEVSAWLSEVGPHLRLTAPDEGVKVGPLEVKLLSTPGHTPGSQCLLAQGALLTGDTLFVNACGRVDFPGGSGEQLYHSLTRLSGLPPETRVYPGHDYGEVPVSTVARERQHNPHLRAASLRAFLAMR